MPVLCRALGGKVAKSYSGWDIGVRKVSLTEEFHACGSYHEIPPALSIIECHQDEVWDVPVGVHNMIVSPTDFSNGTLHELIEKPLDNVGDEDVILFPY
ncbi:hypothetical protein ACS0TY_029347 [Phlomoides rotata]